MNTLPATKDELRQALGRISAASPAKASTGLDFLKLDKGDGSWLYGRDANTVETASRWAINPYSFTYGLICWGDGEVLEEKMVSAKYDAVLASDMPEITEIDRNTGKPYKYKEQHAFELTCVAGPDKGATCLYKATSYGGLKALGEMSDKMKAQNEISDEVVPIIQLDSSWYKHDKFGRIFNPIFDIISWTDMDATEAPDEPEQVEEEKPASRRQARVRPARA